MKKAVIIGAVLVTVFVLTHEREVKHGPGVLAPDVPAQIDLKNARSFAFDEYEITPLADFHLTARILSRKTYGYGRESDLSPIDLALGWGRMSDENVLKHIKISQSGRWYHWKARKLPIPQPEISSNSANMHLIPANDELKKELKKLRKGEVVELRGKLVLVKATDGWRWKSSLTRNDRGNHACELFYVEFLAVKDIFLPDA